MTTFCFLSLFHDFSGSDSKKLEFFSSVFGPKMTKNFGFFQVRKVFKRIWLYFLKNKKFHLHHFLHFFSLFFKTSFFNISVKCRTCTKKPPKIGVFCDPLKKLKVTKKHRCCRIKPIFVFFLTQFFDKKRYFLLMPIRRGFFQKSTFFH